MNSQGKDILHNYMLLNGGLSVAKTVMWALFIIPWLSLFLMDRMALRKYMPVALLATVLNTIIYQMAWTFDWWKYKITLFSWDKVAQVHTVYGVFLVGTIWVFRWTYGRFWVYLLVNLGIDLIYAYGFRALWRAMEITTGGNLPAIGSLSIMLSIAVLLYGYQMWQDNVFAKGNDDFKNGKFAKIPSRSKSGAR